VTDIHIIAQDQLSLHIQEWDVKTINGTLLGVIEEIDDGYMYTDTFGYMETFFEGEDLYEVRDWIADSVNKATMN